MEKQNDLQILEYYMDLCDRQNDTIKILTSLIRKQTEELAQIRTVSEYSCYDTALVIADSVTSEFEKMIN